jgi:hypothetical protein
MLVHFSFVIVTVITVTITTITVINTITQYRRQPEATSASRCCYTVVTLLLHCCYTVVTLLFRLGNISVALRPDKDQGRALHALVTSHGTIALESTRDVPPAAHALVACHGMIALEDTRCTFHKPWRDSKRAREVPLSFFPVTKLKLSEHH